MSKCTRKQYAPKGAYPHPSGGFVLDRVAVTHNGKRLNLRIVHKAGPELKMIARVLVDMAANKD